MIMDMNIGEQIDTRALLLTLRAALLQQVNFIEKHPANGVQKDFNDVLRRSNLAVVREIEHQLGLKPRRKIVKRRR